ncbi:beta-ketoacyl-ACP synthase II [Cytophagaceae bacterium DM2B3-1]|uniref:3-oxoacyl-[acyl-carrier-protein] synthase 2 n=1 Tax=Xanthocytophaga flava TaxID=3048013 RepID=A0ABT7CD41_9BACT|nr:beta-ketoacyl-ACP synthase II [Xanthocytophaga flavus]MDJ1470015.1 beta-ketoacyl-ACP synthase II [Xanthocytophaga flavus]MDJ1491421.1 beta-ketoacyl-ACP synthase II [Xanthocytophaga flavus]
MLQLKRVVVTGLGALTPIGNNLAEFWKSLVEGKSGAAPITKFDTTHFKTKFACELKGYDPLQHFEKPEVRKMDAYTQYAFVAADEALKDAGFDLEKLNKDKVGVIWGSGNGGFFTFQEQVTDYVEGGKIPRFNPFFIPKTIADIASGMISIKHGFRGVNFTTVSACASSNSALVDAFNYIRLGKAVAIVTGGSEAPICEAGIGGFNACKALSTRNDSPETASRPFDVERDGFVMGEGAGCLILEEYEHAKARGAKIYAELVGGGMSADAYHLTGTHPEGEGAVLGMQAALEDAGIQASDIDYLNTHATSTPLGDLSEMKATATLFSGNNNLRISATKSMTGHLLGGAGAIEAIAAVMAIKESMVPATINTKELDPNIPQGLNIVIGKSVSHSIRYAMSNTFGFGGHNATAIFKKYE